MSLMQIPRGLIMDYARLFIFLFKTPSDVAR